MSGLGLLVTASERAGSSNMSSGGAGVGFASPQDGSPRGSKRPADDAGVPEAEQEAAPSTARKEKGQEDGGGAGGEGGGGKQRAGEEEEEEGDLAARRGDLEFCKRNEGVAFTTKAMDGAAAAGYLDMLIWLHKHGGSCTTDAMDSAAEGGHLETVQWLHDNRSEGCSSAALALAAGQGHLSTVQWFYGNGVPGDISKAIEAAQEGGHHEVVDWLKSHSSSKKPRVEPRSEQAATASAGAFMRQQQQQQPMVPPPPPGSAAKSCFPMGMFGSPYGNFSPVNGIVLPGTTAKEIVPKQAATGIHSSSKPSAAGGGGSSQRLRSNMLRSPELTLATSGRLSTTDERQLKAVMEFRKAYSAQALEGSNIPKVTGRRY